MTTALPSVGIVFANVLGLGTPEGATALAEACDRHGVESVWTVEHPIVPAGYGSEYPYSDSGRMPGGDDSPIPDPLIWLTWVAAHSERVKLATGVLILPLRNPGVLAKQVSTLDALSKGRSILGIGVGWMQEEFDALGVPFERRGARTDDYVAALRALWADGESTHRGEFASFERVFSCPKPTQPSVPIVVGGHTDVAARRAGRLGDGFFPAKGDLPSLVETMRAAAVAAGRDPDSIEITTGASRDPDEQQMMADLGVTRVVVPPPAIDADHIDAALERTMDALLGA